MTNLKTINISWTEIETLIKKLVIDINNYRVFNKIQFDCIISSGRGGIVPSRLLSERLLINRVYLLNCYSYNGQESGRFHIEPLNKNIRGMNVLLVDDCMSKGRTIDECIKEIQRYEPKLIKTCCLFNSKELINGSTFCSKKYNGDKEWLVFPWERK